MGTSQNQSVLSDPYIYSSLNSKGKQIRLLRLSHTPKNAAIHEVKCSLEAVDLSTKPCYSALSYTWGSSALKHKINIDGKMFRVSENLFAFLSQKSQEFSFCSSTALWIDQICINQSDIKEKTKQIMQMAEVYSSAANVLIWLGAANASIEAAIDSTMIDAGATLEHEDAVLTASSLLHEIGCNQYWRRLWIMQEMILAPDIIVVFGGREISWLNLARIKDTIPADYDLFRMDELMKLRNQRGRRIWTWQPLIRLTFWCDCNDIRDKIYGILGLVSEEVAITVDYKRSLKCLYLAIIHAEMRRERKLAKPSDTTGAEWTSWICGPGHFWEFAYELSRSLNMEPTGWLKITIFLVIFRTNIERESVMEAFQSCVSGWRTLGERWNAVRLGD